MRGKRRKAGSVYAAVRRQNGSFIGERPIDQRKIGPIGTGSCKNSVFRRAGPQYIAIHEEQNRDDLYRHEQAVKRIMSVRFTVSSLWDFR